MKGYEPGNVELLGGDLAHELMLGEIATGRFWYRIGVFGTPYNLLGILRRVTTDDRVNTLQSLFEASWQDRLESVQREGRLYEIDFSIFEPLKPSNYRTGGVELVRYNPATLTLLEMTDEKALMPVLIRVWEGMLPDRLEIYAQNSSKDGAWLYALQAAKTSITLYGIWLGHVYHWHLVTAAMLRTLSETIPDKKHPVRQLLEPQSNYLIAFNYTLLSGSILDIYGKIAPPSCIATPEDVLYLADWFAVGREFFDDDPKTELAKNGIEQANFTVREPWDGFRVAQNLLKIWAICEHFVKAFVSNTYRDDCAVAADTALQKWMKASADPRQGNIRGLPEMNNTDALTRVLTSLVYHVTAHGVSRLPRSADPWLTFVANFPPCLQRTDFPPPCDSLTTQQLLKYLPNIGTIADMLSFYFAFAYSKPKVPLIPAGGPDKELYFAGGISDPRNAALIAFRNEMQNFMQDFSRTYRPQGFDDPYNPREWQQWPRNIEL